MSGWGQDGGPAASPSPPPPHPLPTSFRGPLLHNCQDRESSVCSELKKKRVKEREGKKASFKQRAAPVPPAPGLWARPRRPVCLRGGPCSLGPGRRRGAPGGAGGCGLNSRSYLLRAPDPSLRPAWQLWPGKCRWRLETSAPVGLALNAKGVSWHGAPSSAARTQQDPKGAPWSGKMPLSEDGAGLRGGCAGGCPHCAQRS